MQYVEMAKRRAKPGSGSSPSLLRERSMDYGVVDIRRYLGDVPFAVVGGLATRLYMAERMTLDVDVLVSPNRLSEAERCLQQAKCERTGSLAIGRSAWRLPSGTPLDLIALDAPWVQTAIETAETGPDGSPYVSLAYLVLMKLQSGRMQDLADVSRMLGNSRDAALADVREVVCQYASQDVRDLESLVALGKLEYAEGGQDEP